MPEAGTRSRLVVFMFTDIAGSTALKGSLGTAVYAELLRRHNDAFRTILDGIPDATELENPGDGFLARFPTASAAVEAGLRFQEVLTEGPWEGERLGVRIGLHMGEVLQFDDTGNTQEKFVGAAIDLAARVESLAAPGQLLMTRGIFDDARQYLRDEANGREPDVALKWMAHGPYLFKGADEPVEVFEVGVEGRAPLSAPGDAAKARRVISADDEEMLGWRPAAGLEVPRRRGWILREKLGRGGFGEVWVGEHRQTKDTRAFKFCFEADRVRSFRRELTLFRLIRTALGDRPDIARLHEVQLEHPPYFLESEFSKEGDLKVWAERQGGIAAVPLETRLDLLARTADAVAAAHSVGVLHKDLKSTNILITTSENGAPRPRLADFGIGALADPSRAAAAGITAAGFSQSIVQDSQSSLTGTQMYVPPESLAGKPFTIQGDIYALGILLYQFTVADLDRPLGQGWQREVEDELLREDIGLCVDGDPDRRPRGASDVAERLRTLEQRRAARREALAGAEREARRKRLVRIGSIAGIALLVLVAALVGLFVRERGLRDEMQAERDEASRQAAIATAMNEFLDDMLTAPNPFRGEHMTPDTRDVRVVDVLDDAAATVGDRYGDEPLVEASVRLTLARTYRSLGAYPPAEVHALRAVALRRELLGDDDPKTLDARHTLANITADLGRMGDAEPMYRALAEAARTVYGAADPRAIKAMTDHGSALIRAGRLDDAKPLLVDALAIAESELEADHEITLQSRAALAHHALLRIELDEAERLYGDVLEARKRKHGPQHGDTLDAMSQLAAVRQVQGRWDEALAMVRTVHDRTVTALGEDHPYALSRAHQLAECYRTAGRYDEAETIHTRILKARRRILGNEHVLTQVSVNDLANLYGNTGQHEKSAAMHEEALDHFVRIYGEEHQDSIITMSNLANDYESLGRLDEAETLQLRALELRRETLGDDNAWTHSSLSLVGELYREQGRLDESLAMHVKALAGAETSLGPRHWYTGIMKRKYAVCLLDLERYAEAEPILLEVHDIHDESFGTDDFRTQEAIGHLVRLYEESGRAAEADRWRGRLVADE